MTRFVLILSCLILSDTEPIDQFERIELDEPFLRIGSEASGHIFSYIIDWDWDSEGNLYITDARERTISVFSSNGDYRWTFGGLGSGPGEFRGIADVVISDSTLFILDNHLSRISKLNLLGEYQDSFPFLFRASRIVSANGHLYAVTHNSEDLVLRTHLEDLSQWEVVLSLDDIPYLRSHSQPNLCQPFYIGFLGDEMHLTFPGILRLVFVDDGKRYRVIEPESGLLEERIRSYIAQNGDWRDPNSSSIPGLIGPFTPWFDNKLLMDIAQVIDGELTGALIGIVIEPANGREIGPRIYLKEHGCRSIRLMPPDRIGMINLQLATLDIYRIPLP